MTIKVVPNVSPDASEPETIEDEFLLSLSQIVLTLSPPFYCSPNSIQQTRSLEPPQTQSQSDHNLQLRQVNLLKFSQEARGEQGAPAGDEGVSLVLESITDSHIDEQIKTDVQRRLSGWIC